ncbi:MAG: thymidylate kinase [Candidatus Hodarchaeota archaeon]
MPKARFLYVDGMDGCGKDTQALNIARYFLKRGETVQLRSHPAIDNYWGVKAKFNLEHSTGKSGLIKAAFFYAMDVIRSLILYFRPISYQNIIFVRYLMGTAYLPGKLSLIGYRFFACFLPTSKFAFFVDVSPEEAFKRVKQRAKTENIQEEMFETKEKLAKMRKKISYLARLHNWFIIPGDGSPEEVWTIIEQILNQKT